ncbi:hypothetical protein NX059_000641 [Plenodomus lindquistii]|nr:hypothetical protein NX059_000641 [Plenodomus lindquistii]
MTQRYVGAFDVGELGVNYSNRFTLTAAADVDKSSGNPLTRSSSTLRAILMVDGTFSNPPLDLISVISFRAYARTEVCRD